MKFAPPPMWARGSDIDVRAYQQRRSDKRMLILVVGVAIGLSVAPVSRFMAAAPEPAKAVVQVARAGVAPPGNAPANAKLPVRPSAAGVRQ